MRVLSALFLGLVGASACVERIEEESSSVGELLRDCAVPVPAGIRALGAPVSLDSTQGSLWIWSGLELEDGRIVENPSAFIGSAEEACSDGPLFATDADGTLSSLLALDDAEQAQNAERTDGRRLALVPTGGFVHEETGYLFYEEILLGPGFFDSEELGTGLCVLPPGASSCERLSVAGSTLLWDEDRRLLNQGGLVVGDRALVYGCRRVASLAAFCTVSGAPLDRLTEPAAYQVHNVFDGWKDDPLDASVIAEELGALTVVPFGSGYLGAVLDIFESRVYVRPARRATDALEERVGTFELAARPSNFPAGGRAHPGLARDDRSLHVSYATDDERAPGLHLATFRFFAEFVVRAP